MRSRANIALLVFLGIGAYFLLTEHWAHVIETLPYLLLLGCLVMHRFMHGGHNRDDGSGQHGHRFRSSKHKHER